MDEFPKKLTNAEELLRQVKGESKEQAIEKWWKLNGLNAETARRQRQETYAKQKLVTTETMRVYLAHTATDTH